MWRAAAVIAFYTDRGWSPGMRRALERANKLGLAVERRTLDGEEGAQEVAAALG